VDVWERYGKDLDAHLRSGLVSQSAGRLRLSRKGMLLANEVMVVFV
jgi:coproporphyrinogen III oxidase-like Fe-S oxidoreductase